MKASLGVPSTIELADADRGGVLLRGPQRGVEPAYLEELGVRAALDEAAAVEHDDLLGGGDRREPVGDDELRERGGRGVSEEWAEEVG